MATKTKQVARILEPLAIRYRPRTIDQIVGQKQVVTRLSGIFKTMKIPNAILLAGTSGCGKTTIGRIIARTLNCDTVTGCGKCANCVAFDSLQHRDYVEINAADARGIDDIRALISKTKYLPQQGALKIFMLDECFPEDTEVRLTANTHTTIKELVEGGCTSVLSFNHKLNAIETKEIVSKTPVDVAADSMVRVRLSDGSYQDCSDTHKWWCVNRKCYVRADELQEGDVLLTGD